MMPALNAISEDPDQTPVSVDLGLQCLPMTLLWDTRH